MSAEDDIRRLIAQKDNEVNSESQRQQLELDALVRQISPAWESYKRTCSELAGVLSQSKVPTISLHRRVEKRVGFFSPRTELIYPEFGRGWGLGRNIGYWNVFGILSTDGSLYRRLSFRNSGGYYKYEFIPFDMPVFDYQGVVVDRVTDADYWTLSVKDGRLHAQVAISPDGDTIFEEYDMEEVIKEYAVDWIMKYR